MHQPFLPALRDALTGSVPQVRLLPRESIDRMSLYLGDHCLGKGGKQDE